MIPLPLADWARVEAETAARAFFLGPPPATASPFVQAWIDGASKSLVGMVEAGYTREAARYELRTGLLLSP